MATSAKKKNKAASYKLGSSLSILYIAIRISTANLSPITDCDEVFNYWEPLHFILYGSGMQTWEYAPQYALRTYAYLLPMAGLAKCLQFLLDIILPTSPLIRQQLFNLLLLQSSTTSVMNNDDKPLLFALLRSSLILLSCYSELSFLSSIHDTISPTLAHWTALSSFTAAGNFHASPAYLPSSTVMILWRLSAANQLRGCNTYAILWGLVAVLAVGWPFCAVLFVSTGLWALWKAFASLETTNSSSSCSSTAVRCRLMVHVLIRTALHAIGIQALVMMIDYNYYGKIVSPIWNIFVYNATAGGDELYGVEPLSYYVKNLLLNFNVVGLLGILSLPMLLGRKLLASSFPQTTLLRGGDDCYYYSSGASLDGLKMLVLIPMYIWMAIVFPRPHKEERFLFPIYPMLCFGASIALEEILMLSLKVLSLVRPKSRVPSPNKFLGLVLLSPFAVVSISRSFALHHNYSAPIDLYQHFYYHHLSKDMIPARSQNNEVTYICTAGEWYRFPSSFFLPPNTQLGFLKSSFSGQLPQPFTKFGSKKESLEVQEGAFNDVNKEEMDRYVEIHQCSYVVELVSPQGTDDEEETPECLQYMNSDPSGDWTEIASYKYLDATTTGALHRILYIPFQRERKVRYKGYNLYSASRSS